MTSDDKELQLQVQEQIAEILPDSTDETFEGLSLSPQEMLFAFKLVETNDNVEAYKQAFGTFDYKKALAQGSKLAKKKDVIEACKRLREDIWELAQQRFPVMMLQKLEAIENYTLLDFYTADGEARLLDSIPEEKLKLASNIQWAFNSKTGERYMVFDLPKKESVIKSLLDLIKVRAETGNNREDTNTMGEAQAKINEIFGNIGKTDETNK